MKKNTDLHGRSGPIPADLAATKNAVIPTATAGVNLGIKKDDKGFYEIFSREPPQERDDAHRPGDQTETARPSWDNGGNKMADLRKEATLQGVNSVKVWACNPGLLRPVARRPGVGADVNDTQMGAHDPPLLFGVQVEPDAEEVSSPRVGGIENTNFNSVSSLDRGRCSSRTRSTKATANGGTLSRQSLFDALKQETKFDAQRDHRSGRHREPRETPACIVMAQIKERASFVRTVPVEARHPSTATRRTWSTSRLDLQLTRSGAASAGGPVRSVGPGPVRVQERLRDQHRPARRWSGRPAGASTDPRTTAFDRGGWAVSPGRHRTELLHGDRGRRCRP